MAEYRPTIIALWAIPRSVSTAFEKTFSRRPDTEIVHEPFTDCYYFSNVRRSSRYGEEPSRTQYDGGCAAQDILQVDAPVIFTKDLCFQAEPYVSQEFLEGAINTFIIRDPKTVLSSLQPLKPDFSEDEYGYLAFKRMWDRVVGELQQKPILIEGDRFRQDPRNTLKRYCYEVGLTFDPGMLEWKQGRIREWAPHENESQAKWHHTLETSNRILPPANKKSTIANGKGSMVDRAQHIVDSVIDYAL